MGQNCNSEDKRFTALWGKNIIHLTNFLKLRQKLFFTLENSRLAKNVQKVAMLFKRWEDKIPKPKIPKPKLSKVPK